MLTTLRDLGWIVVDDPRQYVAGSEVVSVGQAATAGAVPPTRACFGPELRDLTGEAVHVSVPQTDRMLIVGRIDSLNPLRVSCELRS